MAEYRKQIAYLDYLEDGVKIKNAGFVRIEEQNGHNRMEVKVKNLPGKDCGEFRLQEEHERTVGRISLQGGNGNCCMVWRMPEPGELDNSREESWQQTAQLRILLSGKRMLIANWHEPVEIPAQKETLQLQQQSQVQGDQSQQMEARSSQTNSPRQPGAGEIIPYPERRGSEMEKQSTPKEPAEIEQSAMSEEPAETEPSAMLKKPAETEQSAMSKEPAATEQSTMAKEPAATKRQPTPEAPSVSASELTIPFHRVSRSAARINGSSCARCIRKFIRSATVGNIFPLRRRTLWFCVRNIRSWYITVFCCTATIITVI